MLSMTYAKATLRMHAFTNSMQATFVGLHKNTKTDQRLSAWAGKRLFALTALLAVQT